MTIVTATRPDAGWESWKPAAGTVYAGLPDEIYRAAPGISQSGLKLLARSPAHLKYEQDHPRERTEPMMVGAALDCLLFEPGEFEARFVEDTSGASKRGTKAWNAWVDENVSGHDILRPHQHDWVRSMKEALEAHPIVSALMQDGYPQPSMWWTDEETGVLCKGRLDWKCGPAHAGVAWDLKKCQDARKPAAERYMETYGCALQQAFYSDGLKACGHPVTSFAFVLIEEQPPHGMRVWPLEAQWVDEARVEYRRHLRLYAHCVATGEWPGYSDSAEDIEALRRPVYARKRYEQGEW